MEIPSISQLIDRRVSDDEFYNDPNYHDVHHITDISNIIMIMMIHYLHSQLSMK